MDAFASDYRDDGDKYDEQQAYGSSAFQFQLEGLALEDPPMWILVAPPASLASTKLHKAFMEAGESNTMKYRIVAV